MLANMKAILGFLVMLALSYKIGWERAEAKYQLEATVAAQKVEDAVRSASQALAELSATITELEQTDAMNIREIEDAAATDGAHCYVPADRLRQLDSITN